MKKLMKKSIAGLMAVAMLVACLAGMSLEKIDAEAASNNGVSIVSYTEKLVSVKPDLSKLKSAEIKIKGCTKASEIKNLKSSNNAIKVSPKNGAISVKYPDKVCSTTITCTVKNVKLKTTFKVAKYTKDDVYINPFSDKIVSYKPGRSYSRSSVISIVGCDKASEIKNLKSSNKSIKLTAKDGYIRVEYPGAACSTTVTCTVKNVSLKTTFKVVKYSNPIKTMKIDKTNFASKFKTTDMVATNKKFSNKTLTLQANSGWIIRSIYVYGDSPTKSVHGIDKTSYSCKVSLKSEYATITVILENKKTGLVETLTLYID